MIFLNIQNLNLHKKHAPQIVQKSSKFELTFKQLKNA